MAATNHMSGILVESAPVMPLMPGNWLAGLQLYLERHDDATRIRPLRPTAAGGGGDKFYYYNEWNWPRSVQRYRITGDQVRSPRAWGIIFELVVDGRDTDLMHPGPGGSFWTQVPVEPGPNTVLNGPGSECGLSTS